MEIPTIPKVVLDNLLASMGSSATFKEQNSGFRQLPVPVFHGTSLRPPATDVPPKSSAVSLPPLPGGGRVRDLATNPPILVKECADPLAKVGSVLPVVKGKPKRVRKSRAGASSKKRGTPDALLDTIPGAAQQSQPPPPKRRRLSVKLSADGETVEKPPPRKRNRSKAKAKEEQLLSLSNNETSFGYSDPTSSKGILGVYGLETKTLDLSHYMKDLSVEGLMAGDFNVPSISGKYGSPSSSIVGHSFGAHVSSLLQNLTRPVNADQARPVPLFPKLMESKPLKFSLDLESCPIDESEERLGVGLFESKIKAPHKESATPFLQSRKVHEAPPLFSLETIPVAAPTDFWNTLQIHSNVSLSSLLAQASTTTDSRFFPSEVGSNCDKYNTLPPSLPPSIFSLGSSQIPQESSGDRLASSKLNQWFRAEPPKWESAETQPHHFVAFSRGSTFPFKLESDPLTKPSEKCGLKEGLFDIDLNKQSPEAEAAESMVHSTSVYLSGPKVLNEVPMLAQAKNDTCEMDKEPQYVQTNVYVSASTFVNEIEDTCKIKDLQDSDYAEMHLTSEQNNEAAGRLSEESVLALVNKQHNVEQVKVVPMNASSSLPTLFVPDVPETQEMCNTGVPYSPGMQATAHLLCKMANSSSPFYVERDGEHAQVTKCEDDPYIQSSAKAAKVAGLVEKEARVHKHTALHESWNEEYTVKAQARDGKDKLMFSYMGSSNGLNTEPWASTPPRYAPKNVASRISGSQSSESDRSPCDGPGEHRSHEDLGNTNKLQRDQQSRVAASCKVSSLFTRKDPKGNPKPISKTSFLHTLPTEGISVSTQKRTSQVETKQSLTGYGDGLTKVSRPRSNISKNCIQSQRSTNGYHVQNVCSIKSSSSRHVLPYVGEVRHGSK